ncbi:MAG: response regulator [Verrucomicrobiota bacterium]
MEPIPGAPPAPDLSPASPFQDHGDPRPGASGTPAAGATPRRILIVEDDVHDADLMVTELQRVGFAFDWTRVDNEPDFLAQLASPPDLILSDYVMPQFSGPRALELLKERTTLDVPFIIVSGTIGEETAVATIKQGAADYLLKDRIGRLGPAVNRALQEVAERRERAGLQAQFIEAQKMEVVGQLAAGVAHDFNNVLAVIMGYGDLIEQELGDHHPLLRYTEEIRHAAKRASGLTRQLLIFSRKEAVQPEPLDLSEVVGGMDKMLRRIVDENTEMTITCSPRLGLIKADSGYIWQVLMNMVVNARDAMPGGGKLLIKTGAATLGPGAPSVAAGLLPAGDYVTLSVTDTGTGIPPEVKARLFEPFFTTKPAGKGTGLGLVTCQTIIRQSGGHIEVDSEPGQGTTFRIYFPRLSAPVGGGNRSTAPRREPPANPRGTETLLIVEDEPAVRLLAQGVLKAQGYDVLVALNGQDALRVAREHTGPRIALVLTDLVMPHMGGRALAEGLRKTDPQLRILFTSGYTEEAAAGPGESIDFLPKPYSPVDLLRKIREMLNR